MNTTTTTRSTIRSASFAACLTLLFTGATACGSDDGTTSTGTGNRLHTLSSTELIEGAKAGSSAHLQRLHDQAKAARRLRAEHADAPRTTQGRTHGFGDDHRQPTRQQSHDRGPLEHQ